MAKKCIVLKNLNYGTKNLGKYFDGKNAPFLLCGMTLLPGFSNANCDRKRMGKKVYWYKKKAYF